MPHDPQYSVAAMNLALDAALNTLNGGFMLFYGGGSGKPVSPDVAVTDQTLAATLALSATAFAAATGGTKTANPITPATIAATVDVRWFRLVLSDGVTAVHDGTVGTIDQSCDATVGTPMFNAGATATCSSLVISIP